MQIIRFIALWIVLTILFSLFNSSFEYYSIAIQSTNSLLFTIGFYFSYTFLIRKYLYNKKIALFILYYFLTTVFLSATSMIVVFQVYVYADKKFYVEHYWEEPVFFTSNYVLFLLVISTLLSFRFLRDRMKTQSMLENLEKEKISAELSFLKAQINPHFLFNSLNNILFQIDKTNKDARETLLKFSEMLRYQLYECGSDFIEIEKELQYIKNYVEIQMLRKSEKYKCDLIISDSVKNFRIAPLLLIPFIENAFKYVSNHSAEKNKIQVSMDYQEDEFVFCVTNDKDNIAPINLNESAGIGLVNVQRRLDLLYKRNHLLEISDNGNKFSVKVKLKVE